VLTGLDVALGVDRKSLGDDGLAVLARTCDASATAADHGCGLGVAAVVFGQPQPLRLQVGRRADPHLHARVVQREVLYFAAVNNQLVAEGYRDRDVAVGGRDGRDGDDRGRCQRVPDRVSPIVKGPFEVVLRSQRKRHRDRLIVAELPKCLWVSVVRGDGIRDVRRQRIARHRGTPHHVLVVLDGSPQPQPNMTVVPPPARVDRHRRPPAGIRASSGGSGLRLAVDVLKQWGQRVIERVGDVDLKLDRGVVARDDEVEPDNATVVDRGSDCGSAAWAVARTSVGLAVIIWATTLRRRALDRRLRETDTENADADVLVGTPREAVDAAAPVSELLDQAVEEMVHEHLLDSIVGRLALARLGQGRET
jgi:hypothetical protein